MYNLMKVQKRNVVMKMSRLIKFLIVYRHYVATVEFIYKLNIDPTIIAQKVCSEIYDNVKTSQLDELFSQIAISMYSKILIMEN